MKSDNPNRESTYSNVTMAKSIASARSYHRWLFNSFCNYIHSNAVTLEIGAGHGEYTKLLAAISKKVIATDINKEAVSTIKNELYKFQNIEVLHMDGIDTNNIPKPIDNIVAINILEHIKEDDVFVRDCFSVLNKNGRLIIFAPAFPILFSNIDKLAGHFRRYYKRDLENLLINNGFNVIISHYFNFVGFWGWLVNKFMGSGVNSKGTNLQVIIFNKFVWLIKRLEIFSCLCGQSVLIVGEK